MALARKEGRAGGRWLRVPFRIRTSRLSHRRRFLRLRLRLLDAERDPRLAQLLRVLLAHAHAVGLERRRCGSGGMAVASAACGGKLFADQPCPFPPGFPACLVPADCLPPLRLRLPADAAGVGVDVRGPGGRGMREALPLCRLRLDAELADIARQGSPRSGLLPPIATGVRDRGRAELGEVLEPVLKLRASHRLRFRSQPIVAQQPRNHCQDLHFGGCG
jgi:hypothetical protein